MQGRLLNLIHRHKDAMAVPKCSMLPSAGREVLLQVRLPGWEGGGWALWWTCLPADRVLGQPPRSHCWAVVDVSGAGRCVVGPAGVH